MKTCTLCQKHYGDNGPCDEGKPLASPHRSQCRECGRKTKDLAEGRCGYCWDRKEAQRNA